MVLSDLTLALAVARTALGMGKSFDEAVDVIGEALIENVRTKRAVRYRPIVLRSMRHKMDAYSIFSKVKSVCHYSPSPETVSSLQQLEAALESADWELNKHQAMYSLCYLEESLLLIASGHFVFSAHHEQTRDILLDMASMLFEKIKDSTKTLSEHLIATFAQLIFLFSFPDGCENPNYALFLSVFKMKVPQRPISKMITGKVNIALMCEVVKFHIELLNTYCNRHDKTSGPHLKSLISACLLVYDERDLFEFVESLPW